jgi:arylsulfatase A-like enzyme
MPIAGHHPYHAPGEVPRPFPETRGQDEYLNDVHTADDAFGHLRTGLKARGLDDRTVYVVFGDHGEAFGEHEGNVAHALFLYEENLRVPLFVAAPGRFHYQRRSHTPVSAIDLAPTTLALAGRTIPTEHEGHSLLEGPPRVVRFFTEQGVRRAGLRDDGWKLILDLDSKRTQLFDLQADPEERRDLSTAHPDVVARYRGCLRIDRPP